MSPPLVPLGYGKYVRADRIYALVPLEDDDRGDRRRTLVWVDGVDEPIVASRSERAIVSDLNGDGERERVRRGVPPLGQDPLF